MSRTLQSLRVSISVGAFLVVCGAMNSVHAADAPVQRLAMACTHGGDAAGCKPAPMQARQISAASRAEATFVKAPVRVAQESHSAARDNDGSRFTYDSCGCSN